jgi:large subunit ribosomal protein L25
MALQIAVDARSASGKQTKQLRAGGIVPGVVFGKKAGSVPVQVDAKALELLYREAGRTSIIQVSVDGGAPTSVVIKNIQRNPLTGRALHVDFFAPDLTHEMTAEVPLSFTGTAPAIDATGGFLLTSIDRLRVKALPGEMPHEIVVDLGPLVDLDAMIKVSDIPTGAAVTVLNDPEELVAKVMPPRVEEEPEVTAAEELLEGEEPAEGEAESEGGAPSETPAEGGSEDASDS